VNTGREATARVRFDWAGPDDDAAIRALLREATVPGDVALSFQREPSAFAGSACLGRRTRTLVARNGEAVVAVADVSLRRLFVAAAPCDVAYLAGLRVAPGYQGRSLVTLGLRDLRARLQREGVPGAIATVSYGNAAAERVLVERGRRRPGGLTPLTTLHTLTYAAAARSMARSRMEVTPALESDLPEVVAFLARHGARRQLFPFVTSDDLTGGRPGLRHHDVLCARRRGTLVGVLALWDQSAVRQSVVRGYGRRVSRLKPLIDAGRWLRGARPLPRVGEALRVASGSLLCVADDDPSVFRALLTAGIPAARRLGAHALALGLTDEDPLLGAARRIPHVAYRSRLLASPLADPDFPRRLEGVRFVDVGTL
jgi:predicted N-acetyltransferase YhbS